MELSSILSKVIASNSCSEVYFFKGKFQIFLLDKLFAFPGPLGDLFQKGIIVCGGKEEAKRSTKHSSGSGGSSDSSIFVSELDITGSPLECVFDSTLLLEEGSPKALCGILKNPQISNFVYPLSVPDALHIVDLCNLCQVDALREVPLFVICDGKDPENTILTGIFRKNKNSRLKLTCKGPYSKKDEFPTLVNIRKKHQSFYNTTLETSAYAHYDIVDSPASSTTSILKPCKEGALAIKCKWNSVSALLQMPTADASCELLVFAVSGDDHSGAFARYRELKLVQALADSLHTGKVAWPNTESDGKLFEKLIDLINGNDSGIRPKTLQNESPASASDFESSFEASVTGNRKDMDFTDQLWLILTECTSYNELTNALEFVFRELKNTSISPVVYRKNTTTIAKFAQGMSKGGSVAYPSLESAKPIQLLLEIGVEKLQKDYLMLLVGLELCPHESIKPYLQPDKLSDEAVNCLAKLHSVLELTVLCWTHLSLPKIVLNSVVRTALKQYMLLPKVDPSYIFKFPISMLHVKTTIEKHEPTEWQASFLSRCNGYDKQTVLHLSTVPFLQTEPGVRKPSRLPSSPLIRNAYFCTTAVLVEDNFPVSINNKNLVS